jgi:hypothetical protein
VINDLSRSIANFKAHVTIILCIKVSTYTYYIILAGVNYRYIASALADRLQRAARSSIDRSLIIARARVDVAVAAYLILTLYLMYIYIKRELIITGARTRE